MLKRLYKLIRNIIVILAIMTAFGAAVLGVIKILIIWPFAIPIIICILFLAFISFQIADGNGWLK